MNKKINNNVVSTTIKISYRIRRTHLHERVK